MLTQLPDEFSSLGHIMNNPLYLGNLTIEQWDSWIKSYRLWRQSNAPFDWLDKPFVQFDEPLNVQWAVYTLISNISIGVA